jgi:predicted nucleic acid-binding protein
MGRAVAVGESTHYARLKAELAARGNLKARMDLLIAAAALDVGATLVTYDGDFDPKVMPPELTIENWYTPGK